MAQAAVEGGDDFLMRVFNDPLLLGQVMLLQLLMVAVADVHAVVVLLMQPIVLLMQRRCPASPRWLQPLMTWMWIGAMRRTRGRGQMQQFKCAAHKAKAPASPATFIFALLRRILRPPCLYISFFNLNAFSLLLSRLYRPSAPRGSRCL